MMHRPKKRLGSGNQEYFNEKRPVNDSIRQVRKAREELGELCCGIDSHEYQPSPWFCPNGRQAGSNWSNWLRRLSGVTHRCFAKLTQVVCR
jgi:hypothetical protein